MVLVALMCCSTDINAQGILKRLGEKVTNAAKATADGKARDAVNGLIKGKKDKTQDSDDDNAEVSDVGCQVNVRFLS